MNTYKKYLKESVKFEVDGDRIKFGSSVSSIPEYNGDTVLEFQVGGEMFSVRYDDKKEKKIYAFTDKYDKVFKDINEFVKWLNKNNAEFMGVNDL